MKIYEVTPEAGELDINELYAAFYAITLGSGVVEDWYGYRMYNVLAATVVGRV